MEDLAVADSLDDSRGDINILIGSDYYWNLVSGETIRGDSGQTAAYLAGFYLVSCVTPWEKIQFHRIWSFQDCPFAAHKDEELVNTVEKFGKLNPLEYKVKGQILANLWKNLWTLDNGQRYEVELPFKDDCLPILDNYNLCYNRLKSMQFKLSKTPGRSCSKAD